MTEILLSPRSEAVSSLRAANATLRCYLFLLCAGVGVGLSAVRAEEAGSEQRWTAPLSQAQRKNPIPADESSLAGGRKVYFKRCAACHGKTGNGDGYDAIDLGLHPAKFS